MNTPPTKQSFEIKPEELEMVAMAIPLTSQTADIVHRMFQTLKHNFSVEFQTELFAMTPEQLEEAKLK